jgi:hypothetical protein
MEVLRMYRVAALALALGSASASADVAIPEVSFPTLPARAQAAADLVPTGWSVEKEARGDLNGDGRPDVVLLLRMSDPANVISNDGFGAERLDTNPRLLVVAFAGAETDALTLALADHTLIPRHTDPVMEDPLHDVSLVRGTLQVSLGSFMSAGSWSVTNAKLTFRHQDGCFRLIGYDATDYQRNTEEISTLSVNYLTRKVKRSSGQTDDAMKESWRSFEVRELPCLEAVGDGLEFQPDLAPDPDRAAEPPKTAAAAGPRWSTEIGSLTIGAGSETATFRDVKSTCNALRLTVAFASAAGGVRACLPVPETRRIRLRIDGGQVMSSRVDPDDVIGRCVTAALGSAHLDGLTCELEANVSR